MNKIFLNQFKKYVENDRPFPWTITMEHDNPDFIGKSGLELSYIRYGLTMASVQKHFHDGFSVLDVGVYPGIVPKIFKEFFPGKKPYNYYGCGMGFGDQFKKVMADYNVTLLEADLDPRLNLQGERSDRVDLQNESIDMVLCTDVIEHFFDPNHMLQEMNRVMKIGGMMILTTDNVSQYAYIVSLIKGKSNYPPLMESSMFFQGDWRPHFREYSKEELLSLLKHAGFDVIEHKYFDSEFASYKVNHNQLVKINKKNGIFGWAKQIFKVLLFRIKHINDSHLIICKKTMPYGRMLENSPKITNKLSEWVEQRIKFKNI